MRATTEQIKQAVLHDDQQVRDAAVHYLSEVSPTDPQLWPLVLNALERFGEEAFGHLYFVVDLAQTPEVVGWCRAEIERRGPAAEDESQFQRDALKRAIRRAPADALRPHATSIQEAAHLDQLSQAIVARRLALQNVPPDGLWAELLEFCREADEEPSSDMEVTDLAWVYVDALAPHAAQFSARVLQVLVDADQLGTMLEWQAVRLAGKWRLDAAVPQLAEMLIDLDAMILVDAEVALAAIGGDAVLAEIERRYPTANEDFKLSAAVVLEKLHSDAGVQLALELLAAERNGMVRAVLLDAVLSNFATEGIEPARQFILAEPDEMELEQVRPALLVASKVTGERFPEFAEWDAAERIEIEARRTLRAESIERYRAGDGAGDFDDEDSEEFDDEEFDDEEYDSDEFGDDEDAEVGYRPTRVVHETARVGRNDPCPCGSGKKFKKCCYGKQAIEEQLGNQPASKFGDWKEAYDAQYEPIGTVAFYGPDDKTTTKIVAGVIKRPGATPILRRWVGTRIKDNPKVRREIGEFFKRHRVERISVSDGNMGCPHEEGPDFPLGEDCPFCPFWAGKQGSNRHD